MGGGSEGSDLCWLGWAQIEEWSWSSARAAGRGEASLEPGAETEAGPDQAPFQAELCPPQNSHVHSRTPVTENVILFRNRVVVDIK